MTMSTINTVTNHSVMSHHTSAHRPAVDVLVERAARSMLAWSDRRANKNQISHERMDLIRANECVAVHGGSSVAR
jgi:endonuclease III